MFDKTILAHTQNGSAHQLTVRNPRENNSHYFCAEFHLCLNEIIKKIINISINIEKKKNPNRLIC